MKTIPSVLALCLLAFMASAQAAPTRDAEALSTRPDVVVTGNGDCDVTGAMWSYGPETYAHLDLVEKRGTRVIPVVTDGHGIYRATIPKSSVFVERNNTVLRATGSMIPYQWENATVVCSTGSVTVGDILPVQVKP